MLASQRSRAKTKRRRTRVYDPEQGVATPTDERDSPVSETQPTLMPEPGPLIETRIAQLDLFPSEDQVETGVKSLPVRRKSRGKNSHTVDATELGEPTFELGDEHGAAKPERSLPDPTAEAKVVDSNQNSASVYPKSALPFCNESSLSLDKLASDQLQKMLPTEPLSFAKGEFNPDETTAFTDRRRAPARPATTFVRPAVRLPRVLEENQIFSEDLYSRMDERIGERNNRVRTSMIWKTYMTDADREDKEAMALWMDNMDNLLVFAGLFSAILTAFLVLSSANMKPDPLDTISAQISRLNIAVSSPGTASDIQPDDSFVISPRALRINFLWFGSLSFAILAAAGAMLAKSWCLEYSRQSSAGTPFEQAQRRQRRYNGLLRWKFQEIVDLLPGLLYISIILFMIGICDFLVDLHIGLAITTTIIFASGLCFALLTIVASVLYDNCPFRVPLLEAIRHLLRSWSQSRQATMQTPTERGSSEASTGFMGVKHILQRMNYWAFQFALEPLFNRSSTYATILWSYFSARISQWTVRAYQLFHRIWHGPGRDTDIGMDFDEEPENSDDQTVVDSVCWILRSSSDPNVTSATLSLIPGVLRSPQHHLQLMESGACWEFVRRFFDLTQSRSLSLSTEQKSLRAKQMTGLTHPFYFMMGPMYQWRMYQSRSRDQANDLFTDYAVNVSRHLKDSDELGSKSLSLAVIDLTGGYRFAWDSLDKALTAHLSPSDAIGWLHAVRNSPELRGNPGMLANLNMMLDRFWESHSNYDGQVNYAYISALASYLGYMHTKHLTLPSYRAGIYYCAENLKLMWAKTEDPDVIQAVGIIASLALCEARGDLSIQMERTIEGLVVSMSTFWDNCILDRLAALRKAITHFAYRRELTTVVLSHTLQICSTLLIDPASWNAASEGKLRAMLSLSTEWEIPTCWEGHWNDVLERSRLLLSQLIEGPKDVQALIDKKKAIDDIILALNQRQE